MPSTAGHWHGNPVDWLKCIDEIATAGATKLWVGVAWANFDRQKHYMRMFGEQILPYSTSTGQYDRRFTGIGGDRRWRPISP
jgi:hypothetical protein